MSKVRVYFGRYELGGKEGDGNLISAMQEIEKEADNSTDAFRKLILAYLAQKENPK